MPGFARFAAIALALVLGLALAACGGGDDDDGGDDASGEDVVGTYQVTSHRENHQQGSPVACDDPGPEIEPGDPSGAPVFAIAVDDFIDDPDFLVFQTCDDAGAECADTLIHLERSGNLFEKTDANTQTGDASCNLYAGRSSLTLSGGVATLEDRRWSDFDHPASDCTLEAADALIGTAECQDVVVWVGTRR